MVFDLSYSGNEDEGETRETLKKFVRQTWAFLDDILNSNVSSVVYSNDLEPHLIALREGFQTGENLNIVGKAVENIADISLEKLNDHGLIGAPLVFKIDMIMEFFGQIGKGLKAAIIYLMKLLNSLLESLKSALGALGAPLDFIKELKDFIEAKIDLVDRTGRL
ncbi:MAG: hypothetical protein AAGF29_02120 [Pseudomonadota bacterium]